MRIVYLHQYFVTPDMAGGTRSFEMAKRLVRAGHEVHMITSEQGDAGSGRAWRVTDEHGITVHWTPVPYNNYMGIRQRLGAFVSFAWRASARATRLGGDVIFATSTPLTIALPALVASTLRRRPFVFEVRDLWPAVPIAIGVLTNPVAIKLARFLERLTYRRARHVVACAPGMREEIVASGVPGSKVSVIPNGCDDPQTDLDTNSLRDQHAWLGDRPLVLFAGTLGKVNDVSYLARVAAATRRLDPEVRFVVIGDGAERPKVTELAEELGVLDENFFMLGSMPKPQVTVWLYAAELSYALFSGPRIVWKDAVQNKFFDAVAAGKPVAMNFRGWQTELALEADIGLVTDPDDAEKAARTLLSALHDGDWLAGVPDRARHMARGPFSRDTLARRLEEVLVDASAGGSAQ